MRGRGRAAGLLGLVLCAAAARAQLTMHEAVERALRGAQSEVLQGQTEQAHGGVRQARLLPDPRLFTQTEDVRPWADNFDFGTQTENYGYLSQTVEVDGKRRKRTALAEARLRETEERVAGERMQVAGRVSQAYWRAVAQERIVTALEQDFGAMVQMVEFDRKRVEAGATRGVDLIRMEVERDRLRLNLEMARQGAVQARLDLFRAMATPPTEERLTDTLEGRAPMLPPDVDVVLRTRPDVQAARAAVRAAEADVRLQQALGVPDPDVLGGYKRNGADNTLYAGLQIQLPLWNRNQGEVERARGAWRTAQAQLLVLEQQVRADVLKAQQQYASQEVVVEQVVPDMRSRAEQNLAIVREAYQIGGVDLLRLLDAERTAYETEVSAVQAMASLQQYAVTLQLAEGVQP